MNLSSECSASLSQLFCKAGENHTRVKTGAPAKAWYPTLSGPLVQPSKPLYGLVCFALGFFSKCWPHCQIYYPVTFILTYGFVFFIISFSLYSFCFLYHRKRNIRRQSLLITLLYSLAKHHILLSPLSVEEEALLPARIKLSYLHVFRDFTASYTISPSTSLELLLFFFHNTNIIKVSQFKAKKLISFLTQHLYVVISQSLSVWNSYLYLWYLFPSSHCLIHCDKVSVTTISFQLLLEKSTMTSLMYYLINYLQFLNSLLNSGPWNSHFFSFRDSSRYLAFPLIFLASLSHSLIVSLFLLSIFKSVFFTICLRACEIPAPSFYRLTQNDSAKLSTAQTSCWTPNQLIF